MLHASRNSDNLIRINCSNGVPLLNGNRNQSLLLCSLNTCSVRNKTADVFDYACDCKADLFTESWLREGDDAMRAELCPDGYKFMGQNRIGTVRVYSQPMVSEVCTAELLLAEKNCAALLSNRMRNHAFIPTLGFEIYHSTLLSAIFGGRYSCKPDCNNVHWF